MASRSSWLSWVWSRDEASAPTWLKWLVKILVRSGQVQVRLSAEGDRLVDTHGRAPWHMQEAIRIFNENVWWPESLQDELFDLLETKSFTHAAGGKQDWTWEAFKALQSRKTAILREQLGTIPESQKVRRRDEF